MSKARAHQLGKADFAAANQGILIARNHNQRPLKVNFRIDILIANRPVPADEKVRTLVSARTTDTSVQPNDGIPRR